MTNEVENHINDELQRYENTVSTAQNLAINLGDEIKYKPDYHTEEVRNLLIEDYNEKISKPAVIKNVISAILYIYPILLAIFTYIVSQFYNAPWSSVIGVGMFLYILVLVLYSFITTTLSEDLYVIKTIVLGEKNIYINNKKLNYIPCSMVSASSAEHTKITIYEHIGRDIATIDVPSAAEAAKISELINKNIRALG